MPEPDKDFQRRLMATFRGEAEEHVRAISAGLIDLEGKAGDEERAPIVEKIFREAHSLKGAARAVGLTDIETVCQSLESVLAKAKRRELALTADSLDILHRAMDEIERLLSPDTGGAEGTGESSKPADLLGRLEAITNGAPVVYKTPTVDEAPPLSESAQSEMGAVSAGAKGGEEKAAVDETVRVSADQLDRLLVQVEELVPASMGATHHSMELRQLAVDLAEWKREWAKLQFIARSMRQSIDRGASAADKRISEAQKLLDFLDWNEEFAKGIEAKVSTLSQSAERDRRALGTMVNSLLHDTKRLLLRPFSSLTETFPKLVRDLCRAQGKEASLSVVGADVQIDRRILQEIKDPLIHLLRNAIDHGIGKPEERARANKAPCGSLEIAIEQKNANSVEITISDDGEGVDHRQVREAVVKSGLLSAESARAIGDSAILAYIFRSGVSTSPIVTNISGRGLGMAIVRETVERLGGDVTLETQVGKGTTFRLVLPLTVSTLRGLMVRSGDQRFMIPLTFVESVASAKRDSVQTVENEATVLLGGRTLSFVRLREVLELPMPTSPNEEETERMPMVILAAAEKRIAFQVDEVVGEQEVLVKSLGPQLARVRNFGGAAVLGTGKVVPILNVPDLMKSSVKSAARPSSAWPIDEPTALKKKSILVVDDSITARTLVRNILEGAGYLVRTAVDGSEAFAALREAKFDLVVSDVEMPRMNGFDLTAKIRADKEFADLPVILVTALESRQDRERGIDVGANAYVVKSSFEQSDLLEIVRRYA